MAPRRLWQNYREIGRLSAKYVQQVLNGAVAERYENRTVDSVELAINLQTAKQLGITIPPQLLRAQRWWSSEVELTRGVPAIYFRTI
jgi:ABC-type uncharacterized transport system substrate-binding protein